MRSSDLSKNAQMAAIFSMNSFIFLPHHLFNMGVVLGQQAFAFSSLLASLSH
jgi:hypothetical protein